MTPAPEVEVRNLQFELNADVPRYWHGGRRSVTQFFNNLSVFFPVGERFFIMSVKAHVKHVTDPRLLEEAKHFYAQEGFHSREHVRYNRMLRDQGYPVDVMESRVARLLRAVRRITKPRLQLAATCALEHLTALMAHMLLSHPRLLEGAHPAMASLWRWHAAEENEHKAVAFDIFKAAGGTYTERISAMVVASLIFWAKVLEHQARLMYRDGTLLSLREWWGLVRFLFIEPGGMGSTIPLYFDYFKPSFHPWQHDNQSLLEEWKAGLEDAPGYRALA